MANTLFIVEDDDFTGLPRMVREIASWETKNLFAFIRGFQVVTRPPDQFPAALDFTDSVFKLVENDDVVQAWANQSFHQQMMNIRHSIRQNRMTPPSDPIGRFPGIPERIGTALHHKVVTQAGRDRLAVTVTLGTASLKAVQSEVLVVLAYGRERQDILNDQQATMRRLSRRGGTPSKRYNFEGPVIAGDLGKESNFDPGYWSYMASHQSLIDTRDLMTWELIDRPLATWGGEEQIMVGLALARAIAHEARHQYIQPHAGDGLGADSARIFGDRNFAQFSRTDQRDILNAIKLLEQRQKTATIQLQTLPSGQPFPF